MLEHSENSLLEDFFLFSHHPLVYSGSIYVKSSLALPHIQWHGMCMACKLYVYSSSEIYNRDVMAFNGCARGVHEN